MHSGRSQSPENASSACKYRFIVVNKRLLNLDPKPIFFSTFMAGLSKFMAAFRLSRKTAVKVFFG